MKNDLLKIKFEEIESKIRTTLLSEKSIYDEQPYFSVNFKSYILDPLIDDIYNELDQLPINDLLYNKLTILIEKLTAVGDSALDKKNPSFRHQRSHWDYMTSKLITKQAEILDFLENPINEKTDFKLLTELSRLQTAMLIIYLQDAKAIKPYLTEDTDKICDAFEVLTGYKGKQLRKIIYGSGREKNVITTDRTLYYGLKQLFLSMAAQVDNDLSSFN